MQMPQPQTVKENNQLLFMRWLAKNYPVIYNAHLAAGDADKTLSGFFDAIASGLQSVGNVVSQVIQAAPGIISQYGATAQQLQLIKVNLSRAQAGQPPVSASGQPVTASQVAPTLPVDASGNLMTISTRTIATWGMLLAGGAILWFLLRRRRR